MKTKRFDKQNKSQSQPGQKAEKTRVESLWAKNSITQKKSTKKITKNVQTGIFADDNTPNLKLQGEEFDRLRTGLFVVNLAAESPIVCPHLRGSKLQVASRKPKGKNKPRQLNENCSSTT